MFLLVQCVVLAITASQNNSNTTNSTSPSSNSSSTGYTNDTTTTQEPTQTTSVGTTLVPNATTTTQVPNTSNATNTTVNATNTTQEPTPEPTPETPAPEGELVDVVYNFNFDRASCEVAGLQDKLKKLTTDSILDITGLDTPNSDVSQCGSIHIVKSFKVDQAKYAEVQGAGVQGDIETSLRTAIAADPELDGLDLSFTLVVLVANDDVACPLPLPLHAKTTYLLEIAGGENVCLVIECDAGYRQIDNVCKLDSAKNGGISPRSGLSGGEIAGVVIASLMAVVLVALLINFVTKPAAVVAKPTNEPMEA